MVIGERMKTLFRDCRNTAPKVTKNVTSGKVEKNQSERLQIGSGFRILHSDHLEMVNYALVQGRCNFTTVSIVRLHRGFQIIENVDTGLRRPFWEGYHLMSNVGFAGFFKMLTSIFIGCAYQQPAPSPFKWYLISKYSS